MTPEQVSKLKSEAQRALGEGGHALGRFNHEHGPKTVLSLIAEIEKLERRAHLLDEDSNLSVTTIEESVQFSYGRPGKDGNA